MSSFGRSASTHPNARRSSLISSPTRDSSVNFRIRPCRSSPAHTSSLSPAPLRRSRRPSGCSSITVPPPRVPAGDKLRKMNRSPGNTRVSRCNTTRTQPLVPAAICRGFDSMRSSAGTSAVPLWNCTRARSRIALVPTSVSIFASKIRDGTSIPGTAATYPRTTSPTSIPARFTAVLCPATASFTFSPCT